MGFILQFLLFICKVKFSLEKQKQKLRKYTLPHRERIIYHLVDSKFHSNTNNGQKIMEYYFQNADAANSGMSQDPMGKCVISSQRWHEIRSKT